MTHTCFKAHIARGFGGITSSPENLRFIHSLRLILMPFGCQTYGSQNCIVNIWINFSNTFTDVYYCCKDFGGGRGSFQGSPPPFPYETLTRLPLYIGFVTINRFEPIPQWELENGVEMSHSLLVSLFATEFNISLVPWLICTFHFN